jgi:catechol-2,3-dioxygenase
MRLGHVVLRTTRLDAMVDWYCAVLGARVVEKRRGVVFLGWDDEHHRVALVETAHEAKESRLAHVAFAVESLAELAATSAALEGRGIVARRAVNHAGISRSFYYRDPDDNEIEIYCVTARCAPRRARARSG